MGFARGYVKRDQAAPADEKEGTIGVEMAFGQNRGYKRDEEASAPKVFKPNRGYKRDESEGTDGVEKAFGPNRGYKRKFKVTIRRCLRESKLTGDDS